MSSDQFEVSFVDYGNHDTVSASALRPIPPKFTELPSQAFCCQMDGLPSDSLWNPPEIDDLWEFVADKNLQVSVLSLLSASHHVVLFMYQRFC
jgi:hypothetical protein